METVVMVTGTHRFIPFFMDFSIRPREKSLEVTEGSEVTEVKRGGTCPK